MGEIIKPRSNNAHKFEPITGAGEYTQEEIANIDINNFIDFAKFNEEVKALTIPEGEERLRLTIAINVNFVSGAAKTKHEEVKASLKELRDNNHLGV